MADFRLRYNRVHAVASILRRRAASARAAAHQAPPDSQHAASLRGKARGYEEAAQLVDRLTVRWPRAAGSEAAVDERDAPQLVEKPLAQIVAFWRPGSADWSWAEECSDLRDDPVTIAVRTRVDREGIGFADHHSPVLLGTDGRVWDGHHRICIALERGIPSLLVELAGDSVRLDVCPWHPQSPESRDRAAVYAPAGTYRGGDDGRA